MSPHPDSPDPALSIRLIDAAETWELRRAVLWPGHELSKVQLPGDADACHWGAYMGPQLVSVLSVFRHEDAIQIRKFATAAAWRGQGIGSCLLAAALAGIEASQSLDPAPRLWLHARLGATALYERFGFRTCGPVETRDGVAFVRMERQRVCAEAT